MRMSYAQSFTSSAIFVILFSFTIKIVQSDTDFSPLTDCSITEETYALNSTFHSNLKVVLSNLTNAASSANLSFYNSSFGQNSNKVYGLYLCRGDLTTEDCSSCILNITESIIADCPNKTESISWDSKCMLRYAHRNIFSKEEESPDSLGVTPPADSSISNGTFTPPPPVLPTFNRTKVVYDLINETAFSDYSSPSKTRFYATREDNMTASPIPDVLYSLAQCTPDISPQLCHKCLTQASDALSRCPDCLQGYFYYPSCRFQIDVDRFFRAKNDTKLATPPPSSNLVPATSLLPPSGTVDRKKKGSSYIPIAISVPSAMVVLLLCGFCCFFMWRRKFKSSSNDEEEIITMESLQYDISTIKAATNNFSAENKLGQGGFGDVYKGRLQSGQDIAVKRLRRNSEQGIQEFKTEVLLIAKLQHKNLVRLLGFCATEEEKLLIYEYLPHSSLDRLLFDHGEGPSLVWETRYKIIDGIAKGLLHLHEDSRYRIIHRDLKPSNILLDKNMTPKISDFGLAKLFGEDQIQFFSRRIVGTDGYMAPEYARSGQLSVKSDVYSFGVIVLEIVSGQRIWDGFIHTTEHAMRLWNADEPLAFVDPTLGGNFSEEEAARCIHIGLLCIQEDADKRPTMNSIDSMLNNYSDNIPQLSQEGQVNSENGISSAGTDQSIAYLGSEDITSLTGR